MRIGELAKLARCPVETVRYYEKAGLLPAPRRSSGNYREYGPDHVERLSFIRRCRSLDMSLSEVQALLDAIRHPDADCAPVNALIDEHAAHVTTRIAELRLLKSELDAIRAHCSGTHPVKSCGVLESLGRSPARPRSRGHPDGTHGVANAKRSR